MVLAASIICGLIWFAFAYLIMYSRQTPEAQVLRRLRLLIEHAEAERLRVANQQKTKQAKTPEPTVEQAAQPVNKMAFSYRVIRPIINGIENRLRMLTPKQIGLMLEDRIFRAGKQGIWSVNRLAMFWILSVIFGIVLASLIVQSHDFRLFQNIVIILLGAAIGAGLPFFMLNYKIQQRQRMIRRQLPEFLDLLCVSVQAGLSFDGAVAKIVSRMKGPLIVEFKRMQSDVSLGMTKQYALTQVARRCDMEEVYLFTTSIIQAEKLGTSMSKTLKLQADNMRDRHRQYVKTQAMQAPIKILFPMVIFIFPSIFVVLLFPAVLSLLKTLGG